MESTEPRSLTPHLPLYSQARHFLRILDGVTYTLYRNTYDDVWEQRGNPQAQKDWTNPDVWIKERLQGEQQALAMRIWQESKGELNPRYLRGSYYLTTKHDLLARGADDVLRITERGRAFLAQPENAIAAEIDAYEGILNILRLVAELGPAARSELLPGFAEFCLEHTSYRSEGVFKSSLYDRIRNLIARQYVEPRGESYIVTEAGLAYLERTAHQVPGRKGSDKESQMLRLSRELSQEARQHLLDYLFNMDAYKFEELIKFLLEEMGYTDVETTAPSNDKGVDVVANIELGISSVREVVQVKRHRGNINRTVLDMLRGSLHRFSAVRGTIITTGGFSQGTARAAFEHGAAPITLIDGEKLLDLLIEHEIGVAKSAVEYYNFDASKLAQFEEENG